MVIQASGLVLDFRQCLCLLQSLLSPAPTLTSWLHHSSGLHWQEERPRWQLGLAPPALRVVSLAGEGRRKSYVSRSQLPGAPAVRQGGSGFVLSKEMLQACSPGEESLEIGHFSR